VWEFLSNRRLDRRSLVIAVGGGAITDLVGFAAATYMRGISFVAVPTTLLAQVDASIGGKTGLNLASVKNVVGVIRQPDGVIIDTDTLSTLPERELRSGFAEIVKHGLIADRVYFDYVTSRSFSAWSADELVDVVFRSCEIKRAIVESDERESGARKSLNFGHTLGHAIEALALKSDAPLTHGEAVAIGMRAATFLSREVGTCSAHDLERVIAGLAAVGLPTTLATPQNQGDLFQLIALDKKNVRGESRWTLLNGLGACVWDRPIASELVLQAITLIQPDS
jgi:3-dehydroquinate synthase